MQASDCRQGCLPRMSTVRGRWAAIAPSTYQYHDIDCGQHDDRYRLARERAGLGILRKTRSTNDVREHRSPLAAIGTLIALFSIRDESRCNPPNHQIERRLNDETGLRSRGPVCCGLCRLLDVSRRLAVAGLASLDRSNAPSHPASLAGTTARRLCWPTASSTGSFALSFASTRRTLPPGHA